MAKPPKDKSSGDAHPHEEMSDGAEGTTRPLRRRKPTLAPPPAPAGIRPQAPPSAPVDKSTPPSPDADDGATAKKHKRKPTMAPPPATGAIQPLAPPTAPVTAPTSPADSEPTRSRRRPTLAPPPAPAGIRPQAPPTSPASSSRPRLFEDEDDDEIHDGQAPATSSFSDLSEPARTLMEDVADCVSVDSSFDFSQRITDHLATFWEERRDHLITDDDGELEKDYVSTLRVAKSIIVGSLSGGIENLVEAAKSISDELDATSVGYYARNLPASELRVVQSFHDLAVALLFYKVSFHVEDSSDRQVMLVSSMGALGSLQRALDWFVGLPVPEAISKYASQMEFKIDSESRRKPKG